MQREFVLPDLGEGLHEATLVAWKVKEGDFVQADQPLAEVETDKATAELPSPFTGKIAKLHFRPGDRVPVGSVLVTFEIEEPSPTGARPSAPSPPSTATVTPSTPAATPAALSAASKRPDGQGPTRERRPILAAPITRKIAREHGIDLAEVPGTGPGGRITTEDVLAYIAARQAGRRPEPSAAPAVQPEAVRETAPAEEAAIPAPTPAATVWGVARPPLPDFAHWGPVERQPASAIRRRIAERMTWASLLPATVTHADEADVTSLEQARAQAKAIAESQGIRLTLLPYVVKAVVAALKRWPLFNASFDEQRNEVIVKKYYHIGIAVDTPQGLLVPVLRDADRKTVLQLAQEMAQLSERARQGKLSAEDMRGGSFTITNIGSLGGTFFTPLINWPEVAILGLGRIQDRWTFAQDKPALRKILPLCLSFDHRLLDGADAARFVNDLRQFLENPATLLLFS